MEPQRVALRTLQCSTVALSLVILLLLTRLGRPTTDTFQNERDHSSNYFSPAESDAVGMMYSATAHYQLDGPDSDAEFARLLPAGGHVVHIDDGDGLAQEYTVTLFHQFKCIDLIRRDYIASQHPSPLTQHCLTYLRQTILCRPNLGLESTKNRRATAVRSYDAVCRDWTELYKEAERNRMMYDEWREESRD